MTKISHALTRMTPQLSFFVSLIEILIAFHLSENNKIAFKGCLLSIDVLSSHGCEQVGLINKSCSECDTEKL